MNGLNFLDPCDEFSVFSVIGFKLPGAQYEHLKI